MTTSITTIIVDDEPNSIRNLADDLAVYPEINILDTQTSPQKAKKSIIQYQPDLLFLDIEFPTTNGIELLQEIRPYMYNNMHVVFYTAFDKYMIDALRASAFDYLLKPYQSEELLQIVERVKHEKATIRLILNRPCTSYSIKIANSPCKRSTICCCSVIPKYSISSTPTKTVAGT